MDMAKIISPHRARRPHRTVRRALSRRRLIEITGAAALIAAVRAAFPAGATLVETKLGALFSLSAAVLAPIAAWALRSGRFVAAAPVGRRVEETGL